MVGLLSLGLVIRLVHPGPPPPEGGGDSLLVVIAQADGNRIAAPDPPPGIAEDGRIRINLAGEADLDRLPGIGPALAKRILLARADGGPFSSIDDLRRVKGIGPKIAERLKPMLSFAVDSTPGAPGADRNGELHPATAKPDLETPDGSEP